MMTGSLNSRKFHGLEYVVYVGVNNFFFLVYLENDNEIPVLYTVEKISTRIWCVGFYFCNSFCLHPIYLFLT